MNILNGVNEYLKEHGIDYIANETIETLYQVGWYEIKICNNVLIVSNPWAREFESDFKWEYELSDPECLPKLVEFLSLNKNCPK